MNLTPDQVRQFREHGYLALPEFFDREEVAGMQAELERLTLRRSAA